VGAISFWIDERLTLSRAGMFLSLREHATAVQRIINDLANRRSFRIYIHSVARFQMSDDAFCGYLESDAVELGITSRLYMIDSHKPLIQRQVCIKSHDCLYSSRLEYPVPIYEL
jgi:hypothetical protein